jgi:hypothetical protein
LRHDNLIPEVRIPTIFTLPTAGDFITHTEYHNAFY